METSKTPAARGTPRGPTDRPRTKQGPLTPLKSGRYHEDDDSKFSATIGVAPEVAYAFFRDFQNLPLFMKDLASVDVLSGKRSHWTVEIKGMKAEWDAEITAERSGEMIAWRSVAGSDVETSGAIWFTAAPENLGTIVNLSLSYEVPGGKLTELIAKFSGEDPGSLAFTNLRRLKCYLETGEIATIDGQPSGRDDDAETIATH